MSGYNIIIGQSGGATAVINASLVGAVETALQEVRIDGIYGMRYGIEGLLQEQVVDLRQEQPSIWSQLLHTPSAALGSCRYKLKEGDLQRALAVLRRYNIHHMLYIGGNDSADTAHQLALAAERARYELHAISVPKTIDNDLPFTDHCPGYGSAARFIAQSTIDSTMNTLSMPWHYPIKIIEVMGRDAGWLAASSALGKRSEEEPPHLILFPEQRFNEDRFLAQVQEIHRRFGYAIIVAAETIKYEKGQALGSAEQTGSDAFHHPLLSGTGQTLVDMVKNRLNLRARFEKPGDLQRMSSQHVSTVDRDEARLVGQAGIRALLNGETDKMVTLVRHDEPHYHCTTGLVELSQIANQQRLLPDEYLNESKTMVTMAYRDYALPLVGEPLQHYPTLQMQGVR